MENNKWFDKVASELKEMPSAVDANLWTGISAQIGSGVGIFAATSSTIKGIAIGAVVTTVAVVAVVNTNDQSSEQVTKKVVKTPVVVIPETTAQAVTETKVAENTKKIDFKNAPVTERTKNEPLVMEVEKVRAPEPFVNKSTQGIQTERDIILIDVEREPTKVIQEVKRVNAAAENINYVDITKSKSVAQAASLGIMPNVFTPNNDGANDLFKIDIKGLDEFSLVVLNGKNEVVWKTINPKTQWDGVNMNGEKVPAGDYLYFISGKDAFGEYHVKYQMLSIKY